MVQNALCDLIIWTYWVFLPLLVFSLCLECLYIWQTLNHSSSLTCKHHHVWRFCWFYFSRKIWTELGLYSHCFLHLGVSKVCLHHRRVVKIKQDYPCKRLNRMPSTQEMLIKMLAIIFSLVLLSIIQIYKLSTL